MNIHPIRTEFFECICHSDEHTLRFSYDPGPEEMGIWAGVFLNQYHNIFQRIWITIKYVFGYKCKYGHWDCFQFKYNDIDRFVDMLTTYKNSACKLCHVNERKHGSEFCSDRCKNIWEEDRIPH